VPSTINTILKDWDFERHGADLHALVSELYPFCRSITGDGLRRSLHTLEKMVPLSLFEIPTGTKAFDWSVPKEWNIRDAWIKDSKGVKVVDFKQCNLHVVNYSTPVHCKIGLDELRKHLFTLPNSPHWIPYRTSYYKETWGFCLTQRQADALKDDEYEVFIDSSLEIGSLTYGQFRIQGETDDEILVTAHSCHPSLCNDNLSGMAVAAKLTQCLRKLPLRYSYRFLWIPATIGTIAWMASPAN
jgi:aminopeptidase-like protein